MLRSATGALLGLRRSAAGGLLALASRFSTSAAAPALPSASAPAAAPASSSAASSAAAAVAAAASSSPAGAGIELQGVRRELDGSRHAQYARRHGLIPGLVYSAASSKGGGTLKVYVKEADLRREVNRAKASFLNTLVTLVVDGVRYRVLPRDLQLHPFRPKLVCCNWYRYSPGKSPGVKVDIPLVPSNEERCPAYREGGWLLQLDAMKLLCRWHLQRCFLSERYNTRLNLHCTI
jgi:ribosomal protein L25 (general stress protein Ctc)